MEQPAAEKPKRPRGSRGGKQVQKARAEGLLPPARSRAARNLNAKIDRAKKAAAKNPKGQQFKVPNNIKKEVNKTVGKKRSK